MMMMMYIFVCVCMCMCLSVVCKQSCMISLLPLSAGRLWFLSRSAALYQRWGFVVIGSRVGPNYVQLWSLRTQADGGSTHQPTH